MKMRRTACAMALGFLAATPLAARPQTAPTEPASAATVPSATEAVPPADASATLPPDALIDEGGLAPEPRDRFEKINRAVWGFNQGADRFVIRPVATVYRTVAPPPARRGLSRIFANLNEPWSAVNNLLQGKVGRAFNNLGRFVVNTTIGVGGLADHATGLGLKPTPEDFGQTLAVWGVKSSAYVVLPLFGPSTVRDGIGTGVAAFADPYNICIRECTGLSWVQRTGIQAGEVVSIRSDLIDSGADAFLKTSLDPYAAARSAYFQNRAAAIADTDGSDMTIGADTPAQLDPTAADAPPPESAPDPAAASGAVAAPGDGSVPNETPPASPATSPPEPSPGVSNPKG